MKGVPHRSMLKSLMCNIDLNNLFYMLDFMTLMILQMMQCFMFLRP